MRCTIYVSMHYLSLVFFNIIATILFKLQVEYITQKQPPIAIYIVLSIT
jgi:hypothetical protein